VLKLIAKIVIEVGIEKLPEIIQALHPEADDELQRKYRDEVEKKLALMQK
jgi:hypothetical protein